MDVNMQSVSVSVSVSQSSYTSKSADTNTSKNDIVVNTEIITQNEQTEAAIYEKGDKNKDDYKVDMTKIQQMLDESNKQKEAFIKMVQKTLFGQANNSNIASTGISFTFEFMQNVASQADEETINEAKQAVSEDGYFGVKQTSERILGFAKAMTGGDPSKIDAMKDAVIKGFEEAKKMWGDELPEISQQTYDAVMKGFDEWTASANASSQQ